MSRVIIVEYSYDPPPTEALRSREAMALDPCLEVREVRCRNVYWSVDGSRKIAVYEAVDAEAVRNAHRSARVTFERAWPADEGPA